MATSDITFQNGNFKHPYLLAFVRWCVSSFWSTATVILHRLVTTPLPPITASKAPKSRPASSDHLHPEPKVECVVLHTPEKPTIDVIFVHGLYGSLANTWRQGEWMSKYEKLPTKVCLRRPHSKPDCKCTDERTTCCSDEIDDTKHNINTENAINEDVNDRIDAEVKPEEIDLYKEVRKVESNENIFVEGFYNKRDFNQVNIVGNYETQAQFVRDLFERSCDNKCDKVKSDCECVRSDCKCEVKCVGCGCVCDDCYSPCWPRDWVRMDYPGARVISINYTSDPYLWRPLWIREIKRLRLHERAEQMISQLLELGVGERPIIWVGHSKGGLFIKQIYCEAYEALMKVKNPENMTNGETTETPDQNTTECRNDNMINHYIDCDKQTDSCDTLNGTETNIDSYNDDNNIINDSKTSDTNFNVNNDNSDVVDNWDNFIDNNDINGNLCDSNDGRREFEDVPSKIDEAHLLKRSRLYTNSAGFMFYSVPHRGSPLADIKTPLTKRSVELMEIAKDCSLVLSLQQRWLAAIGASGATEASGASEAPRPAVRSVVETCRTLMSVLYLRIVSVDSADPGIGSLTGISLDHREICKPRGRACLLYQELLTLMRTALADVHTTEENRGDDTTEITRV